MLFCGDKILPNKVDPMGINVVARYDKLSANSPSQDFYVHFNCFKERLGPDISGYFLESNFKGN